MAMLPYPGAIAGSANGKYSPSAQHQQAVMMDLFPDLQQPHPPPLAQLDPQQLPDDANLPQPSDDILAGNLDQLKQHLQIARVCHAQKAASGQADGQSKQLAGAQAAQTAAAQAQTHAQTHVQANGAVPVASQAARQQRKPQPPPHGTSHRSRQQAGSDRLGSDRWLNEPQPPLHRSISPPLPLTHAAPPLLQQHYPPQAFLHPNSRDSSDRHALQQQPLWRGQHMPQWGRPDRVPSQHPPPPRSSSADNLQRHPAAKAARPAGAGAAGFGVAIVLQSGAAQQAGANLEQVWPQNPNTLLKPHLA